MIAPGSDCIVCEDLSALERELATGNYASVLHNQDCARAPLAAEVLKRLQEKYSDVPFLSYKGISRSYPTSPQYVQTATEESAVYA